MRLTVGLTAALLIGSHGLTAQGASREEVLAGVYAGASSRAEQVFLTTSQQDRIEELSGGEVPSALVARYIATRGGTVIGHAYVDTHTVRTKRQSLLIALDAAGAVLRVEVTAFLEPPEFRASELWLRQYRSKSLTDNLAINRGIRPLAGATLTTRAVNLAVRRALATDTVLRNEAGSR